MSKVSVIGAGNVGASVVNALAALNITNEIVLLDIKEGIAEGKAIDMMQSATMFKFNSRIIGVTNDYKATENSDVVVITSGMPRKPGMSREDLIGVNAGIVKDVVDNILKYSPNAILVIVSNPMDTMTYLTLKATGLPKNRIIGMGGMLDSNRFKYYLSQAIDKPASDIQASVIGGHGDTTMIPLRRFATYAGQPIENLISKEQMDKVVADTMVGGATLTKLLGTSAWYAPGASSAVLVESIVRDQKKIFPCCVYLDGEYGLKDICIGTPIVLGKKGIEGIVDYKLNDEEKSLLEKSADAVRNMNNVLKDMNLI